jgi:hypothetical protein
LGTGDSIILTVLIGTLLVLVFFVLVVAVSRAIGRRADRQDLDIVEHHGHFTIAGKALSCSHCGGSKFTAQQVLLNTWLMSLLRIDWLDSSATVLSCNQCSKLSWFARNPSRKR